MKLKTSLEMFGIDPKDDEKILGLKAHLINGDKQLKRELIQKQREIKIKRILDKGVQ